MRAPWLIGLLTLACTGTPSADESAGSASRDADEMWLIEDWPDQTSIEHIVVKGDDGEWRDSDALARGPRLPPFPAPRVERLLAVRVAWENDASSCSEAQIGAMMFGDAPDSIAGFYRRASFDRLNVDGEVAATVTISRTEFCQPWTWSEAVDAILIERGIDVASFTKRMYMMPGAACGWSGLGELGGVRSWLNGGACHSRPIVAHELGHTLGMHHASTPGAEYGDMSDIMGGTAGALRGFNAPHLVDMGWHDGSIDLGSEYGGEIVALASSDDPRVIRAPGDGDGVLSVSLRSRVAHDSTLEPFASDRVFVHRAYPGQMRQTMVLASLGNGESWSGDLVTVTAQNIGTGAAKVLVTRGCRTAPPTVEIDRLDVAPGGSQQGRVRVMNNDFGACAPASFVAEVESEVELEAGVELRSGETWTRAGAAVVPGYHALAVTIWREGTRERTASTLPIYVDDQAPIDAAYLTAALPNPRSNQAELNTWIYFDDSGYQGVELERDGAIIDSIAPTDQAGRIKLSDKDLRVGVHTYRVRVIDRAGNHSGWSEPASVIVRVRSF